MAMGTVASVIVGAITYDNSNADAGAAYVSHGSPSGNSPAAGFYVREIQTEARMGHS